jgi:hypothetical protein
LCEPVTETPLGLVRAFGDDEVTNPIGAGAKVFAYIFVKPCETGSPRGETLGRSGCCGFDHSFAKRVRGRSREADSAAAKGSASKGTMP